MTTTFHTVTFPNASGCLLLLRFLMRFIVHVLYRYIITTVHSEFYCTDYSIFHTCKTLYFLILESITSMTIQLFSICVAPTTSSIMANLFHLIVQSTSFFNSKIIFYRPISYDVKYSAVGRHDGILPCSSWISFQIPCVSERHCRSATAFLSFFFKSW